VLIVPVRPPKSTIRALLRAQQEVVDMVAAETTMQTLSVESVLRRAQIAGILERSCQELELTEAQFELAKSRYESVGAWLGDSQEPLIRGALIYPQGSVSLGTTVKPLHREEHDLDLVSLIRHLLPSVSPSFLKRAIGDRLRANGHYRDILEEKPRCWRLVYANEFHLDITPSIPNPACLRGGELVPEKHKAAWKPSNPKGYRTRFEERARIKPRIRLMEAELAKVRAQVEALPEPTSFKGLLRRTVQICKRHRDVWFSTRESPLAPISIVLTELAARSYAHCASTRSYDTELDLFLDVVRSMPAFIDRRMVDGAERYYVWNETTEGENFAEKWNADPRLARAFFAWHVVAVTDFEQLVLLAGLDQMGRALGRLLGEVPVNRAIERLTQAVSTARTGGRLSVVSGGLTTGAQGGIPVRSNTFFGR
jgi:hypothetical protein